MKNKRKLNKLMPIVLVFSLLTVSLIGCGNTTSPAVGEDVVSTEESSTEESAEIVESSNTEVTGKVESSETEITDGEITGASKSEEPSVTASPEPTPTTTPEPTPTPTLEPTEPPHSHQYTETITRQPSCSEAGEKTLICSCGDSKTETVSPTGNHNWVEEMQTITYPSTGHVETVRTQTGTTETRHEYECKYCGFRADTASGVVDHQKANMADGMDHAFAGTIIYDYPGEPIYEETQQWVVDTPERTEIVGTGRFTCSVCGATK